MPLKWQLMQASAAKIPVGMLCCLCESLCVHTWNDSEMLVATEIVMYCYCDEHLLDGACVIYMKQDTGDFLIMVTFLPSMRLGKTCHTLTENITLQQCWLRWEKVEPDMCRTQTLWHSSCTAQSSSRPPFNASAPTSWQPAGRRGEGSLLLRSSVADTSSWWPRWLTPFTISLQGDIRHGWMGQWVVEWALFWDRRIPSPENPQEMFLRRRGKSPVTPLRLSN